MTARSSTFIAALLAILFVIPTAAEAQSQSICTVTASASRNDTNVSNSGTLAHLRVLASGGTSDIFDGTTSSPDSNPAAPSYVCSGATLGAVIRFDGDTVNAGGTNNRANLAGGGTAFTFVFDSGGTLSKTTGSTVIYFTPAAGQSGNVAISGTGTLTLPAVTQQYSAGTHRGSIDVGHGNNATAGRDTNQVFTISVTVVAVPTIASLTPTSGSTAGTNSVTITGSGFSASGNGVTFGGSTATITAQSTTSITATVPAHAAGAVDVAVTTADGQVATRTAAYTYLAPPAITSVAPPAGPTGGGTSVVITGTGFVNGGTTVKFGANPATAVTFNSAMEITATAPAGTAGATNVTATTAGGTSATGAGNAYTYTVPIVNDLAVAPSPVATGAATTATFTLTNPAGNPALAGVATSIALPTTPGALVVAASPAPTNGCGGTLTATAGSATITLTAGTLAANANCSFSVALTTSTAGSYTVPSGTATSTTTAAGTATTKTLTVNQPVPVAGSFTAATVAYGTTGATSIDVSTHTTNSPTSYAVGSATTSGGGTVSISNAGIASYTARAGYRGNDTFTYTATNAAGTSSPAGTVTVPVANPTLTIGLTGGGTQGTALSGVAVTASGGTAPYSCATTPASGALPAGTALNADCTISGTPTASGTFTFTATVTDSSVGTGPFTQTSGALTLTITAAPPVASGQSVTTPFNTVRAITLTASNAPTSYAATTPAHGALSGTAPNLNYTPTSGYHGADSFTFTATNAGGTSASATVSITVGDPTVTLSGTPPAGQRGSPYSFAFSASGGTAPYTFTETGALPAGLILAANGTLSGTPAASGIFPITVTVTDSSNPTVSQSANVTLTIAAPTLALAPSAGGLPAATVGTGYSQTISASGGTAPYSYAVTAGALPAGVTLTNGGVLSGTPTTGGSYGFTVTATDASSGASGGPYTAATAYTLAVQAATVSVTPATLPPATVGVAYSQTVGASGGTAPYSYAVTAGALPADVTLSAGGTLAGTPSAGGSFTFTITATDSSTGTGAPYSGGRSHTLTVAAPTVAVAPATLPDATRNVAYSQTLSATGGTAPYAFAVTAGALPGGLTLATNGMLSGTPTAGGSFTFTATATDSSTGGGPYAGSRSYTVTVAAPTIALAPAGLPGGTVATAYSASITASGGVAPYTYAVTAGALPAGLTLATDGTLAGTPTAGGTFNPTVTATDANGNTGSRGYTLTIAAATVALAPASLPGGTAGTAYSQSLTASGGTAPYTYAVTAGALPAGLTLAASGTLSGTPTASGSFTFSATATDSSTGSGPYSGTRSYTLAIAAPALSLSPSTLPGATVATAYSQTLAASGGTAPYTYAVSAGALPAGVTLSAGGTLSGTPSAGGSFTFTVTATDSAPAGSGGPYAVSRAYTLAVAAPTIAIAPASLPAGTSGTAYSQTLSASGGTAPYSYAVTAGALPAGLTLAANGALSGTPSASGSFSFSVTATDSSGGTGPYAGTRGYTLTISAPNLTLAPATLPGATVASAYSQTLTASGGTAPYSYAVTGGALPAGVTLSTGGTLSGTPTAGGSFTFTVTATDGTAAASGGPYVVAATYTLTVAAPTVVVAPASLAAGQSGVAYSQSLTASGGNAPYTFAITAGALPAGLSLSAGGTLSGTPGASGSFSFSVTATDGSTGTGPYAGTRSYTLTIAAPTLALSPAALPGATVAAPYSQAISASGGTAPYSYAVTAGALPAGVTLSTSGTLAGTPSAGGSFGFTVTATDATAAGGGGPYSVSRAYTLTVAAPTLALAPATLPAGTSGTAYSQTLTTSGGTAPYSYAVTAGALPTGLTLSNGGTLSGTPTASGNFTFSATATDSSTGTGPYSTTRSYTVSIAAPTLALAPATLADATVATAYSQALTASGGTAPYTYAVTAGALPAGLSLSAGGTLSGTPSAGGSFAFTVTATDATAAGSGGPYSATRAYNLTVAAPAIAVTPASLPAATSGTAYSQALTASGGTGPYSFAVTAGTLPAGLTLSSNGTLSGTPSASGSFTFSVTATDSSTGTGPYAATRSYTLAIAAPALALSPASLAGATVASPYSQTITASGGTAPYGYAVTAGALPAGVTLSANGTLAGTPTAGGSFGFTVTATDATAAGSGGPYTVSRAYTLDVAAATVTVAPASLPAGQSGTAYSQALTAAGGTAPYAFSVTAGALLTGITLSSSGTLSGTPTASGSFSFSVTATDGSTGTGPYAATQGYTLAIAAPTLSLSPATLDGAMVGNAYSQTLIASGGTAPYSYAVTAGTLPAGITLSPAGTLSGTPTAGGSFQFTVTVTDGTGGSSGGPYSASRGYTLTVGAATVAITPASLPAGTSGSAYSQTITASGGTAPYTYALTAGALPAGVALAANGTLSGTPTASGSFTFSITATDSSSGAGPYSTTRSYTLAIAAPALTIAPATLPGATVGATYGQTLSASGGTAPYAYSVTAGALPTGITLTAGGTLSGTPTTGGTYGFTVAATDSTASGSGGPYTASRAFTLSVALPPPPVAQDAPPRTVAGSTATQPQSLAIDLSALVSGDVSDIQISTSPQHGTATVAQNAGRFTATYTPTAGYGGGDGFAFVAIGAGGRSSPAQVSITVAGAVPVAPALRATTMSGQPVILDLTTGVANGPFTAARIVSVSPADAVAAELIEGGTAGARTYQLRVTPAGRFSGDASIQYTVSNAFGASAIATATVTVNARPDPTQDATVRGIVTAQAETTRRFATAQTDNFMRRAERLHGGDQGGNGGRPSFGVRFNGLMPTLGGGRPAEPSDIDDFTRLKMEHATTVAGGERRAGLLKFGEDGTLVPTTGAAAVRVGGANGATASGAAGTSATGPTAAGDRAAPGGEDPQGDRKVGSVALWSGGAVTLGVRDATTRRVRLSATTAGLSAGADVKLSDGLIVGAGGGYGSDRTKLGDDAGRIDSDSWSAVLYASAAPADGLFVDGVLGLGRLDFRTRRAVTGSIMATGHRDGSMVFGSLATGFDRTTEGWMLSAYGRIDYLHADLGAYVESGGGLFSLAFDKRDVDSLAGILGLRGSIAAGAWTPRARLEFRHDFNGGGSQALDYAGLTGYGYLIGNEQWVRDSLAAEIGTELRLGRSWRFGVDVGGALGNNSRSATGKVTLSREF